MTVKQRILSFLQNHPEGVDDDALAFALGFSQRQQANMQCRKLEKEGLVIRRQVNGKINNFLAGKSLHPSPTTQPKNARPKASLDLPGNKPWYWEGNIQSRVISYLASHNFQIRSVADTASRQQGIDIVAEKDGRQLWISAKGFPEGTERTSPSTEAGHWFKGAIFDILDYRGRDKSALLAIALPDFPRYHSLAEKIAWCKPVAKFVYFWVKEDGEVIAE
jgi:hypothetical protein